jgi:S-adenosylmethionine synthetase
MGREYQKVTKVFNKGKDNELKREVELFTWEKLDMVNDVKKAFKIK